VQREGLAVGRGSRPADCLYRSGSVVLALMEVGCRIDGLRIDERLQDDELIVFVLEDGSYIEVDPWPEASPTGTSTPER
jgi:hypothetical protein